METVINASANAAPSVSDAIVQRAARLPVAVLSDAVDALGLPSTVLDPGIRHLCGAHFAGRARTIERMPAPPNATQAEFDAKLGMGTQVVIDTARPGDVIVIDAKGDCGAGLVGDNMGHRARDVGAVGFIIDGAVRDIEELDSLGLRIYGRGVSPRQGMRRFVTTAIDRPIVCGGVRIGAGDLIVGDADGVIVVPHQHAASVVEKAEAIESIEANMKTFLNAGNTLVDAVAKYKQR